jgi:hypothetical protein
MQRGPHRWHEDIVIILAGDAVLAGDRDDVIRESAQ